ncbi:ATP-binding protein [Streptomyces sp. NPDC127066]|uniref:ATP-binding protein n=1 Tax=Streptomyces sp. NPDC127066 TaxID=3347125 RepID=UPI003663B67C
MAVENLTAEDVDYIQRTGFRPPPLSAGTGLTEAPSPLRMLMQVDGIGRTDKSQRPAGGERLSPVTRDLLVGLSNYRVPLSFLVGAQPGRAALRIGTWLPTRGSPESVAENGHLIKIGLQTLYSTVEITADHAAGPDGATSHDWELGGLALGVPIFKPPEAFDGLLPYDRLLRSLAGLKWAALILAQPVGETLVRNLRLQLINERRSVQTASKLGGVPSPLADTYDELLARRLDDLTEAQNTGGWRTAVYLLGDADSYGPLASMWRGIFSGEQTLSEPIRVWDREDVPRLAAQWALPDPVEETAPGCYRHPFQHQTLLTSAQLATYVHLPNTETNGFAVTQIPEFDTVAPPEESDMLILGSVVERQQVTTTRYGLRPDKLTRHAFVTGVTGSGKTNTVFHLLRRVADLHIPFLVLEPAKTEYRVLLRDEGLIPQLQIFTPGNETVSPFRLNPFEVPEGIPLAVHLDLLRSVFNASFGMWAPLPQIIEVSMHGIYADRGWDVTTDTNRRLDETTDRMQAFPTLTDLVRKVEAVVPQLGYEDKITGDLRAALCTRLNSLRTGGKGRMLDVHRSLPVELLLGRPTVLELEGMGDDDDKAFMMGLLMIRLAEHRRTQGDVEGLRHLLIIEEAHRILANTVSPRGGEESEANARGKAVETFTNLLSEIRVYGQGVVVVDQIPSKLAPDVLKNTNLKIAHRIVAGDDRDVLGATMVMQSRQNTSLATLPIGRAAVFTDGEDAPLLIQVSRVKGGTATWPTNDDVRNHMAQQGPDVPADSLLPSADCDDRCLAAPEGCETARDLLQESTVMRSLARLILSSVQTRDALYRTWPDVLATVEPRRPPWVRREPLLACLANHGARQLAGIRGAGAGWTYAQSAEVAALIDHVLSAPLESRDPSEDVIALRAQLLMLQGSGYGPYQGCARIWGNRPGPCLCAQPVSELVGTGAFTSVWTRARDADRTSSDGERAAVWDVCLDAAYQLIELPEKGQPQDLKVEITDIAHRVALCFAQQMFASEKWSHPATERRAMLQLMAKADHSRIPSGKGDIDE